MNKSFWIVLVLVVVGLIGLFVFTNDSETNDFQSIEEPREISDLDRTKGVAFEEAEGNDNVVSIIEYADFQCPACASYEPIVEQVLEQNEGDVIFAFRHFPLVEIHARAIPAHRAAEAAGLQGKFWEMHDILYARQSEWSEGGGTDIFKQYAEELELDVAQFENDLTSEAVQDAIDRGIEAANAVNTTSTPTFVVNGEKLEQNPRGVEEFNQIIAEALNSEDAEQATE